mgnify:CR=1 FL=1
MWVRQSACLCSSCRFRVRTLPTVQMLPDFIAKVSPLLPLTHAVTMMRAAIAGIYDMDYWRAAGMLLAFVPPLLLLGLLLRKPLVRFNQWYVAQVESTKVLS